MNGIMRGTHLLFNHYMAFLIICSTSSSFGLRGFVNPDTSFIAFFANDNLDKKLKDKERRKSFRLKVDIEECEFQILKIGNKNIDRVKDRKGFGIIKDLSFTGLRLESAYDLPVKDVVEIKLEFEFDEHEDWRVI